MFSSSQMDGIRKLTYKDAVFDSISHIEYQKFFVDYLLPNKPCIFSPNVTELWNSRKLWVTGDGKPNIAYLRKHFGDAVVPVADCKVEQYSSHPKREMTLNEYLDYWQEYQAKDYPPDLPCLYLKDWHFTKAFPDYTAYETPVYFQSDWLNEFWDTLPQDDYRFVYMGPKGTWTPFHTDVYRSHSWSANICGRKKWIFYPPGCEQSLKDRRGNLVYDITSRDLDNVTLYPHAREVKGQQLQVIQDQGQIIFVPSGWHHQVFNLEDTISINHNWLNGSNVDLCWRHLQASLGDVQREIADCRDMDNWEQHCQVILNASAGIDYKTFIRLLKTVAANRLHKLQSIGKSTHYSPIENYVHEVFHQQNCTRFSDGCISCSENKLEKFTPDIKSQKPSAYGDTLFQVDLQNFAANYAVQSRDRKMCSCENLDVKDHRCAYGDILVQLNLSNCSSFSENKSTDKQQCSCENTDPVPEYQRCAKSDPQNLQNCKTYSGKTCKHYSCEKFQPSAKCQACDKTTGIEDFEEIQVSGSRNCLVEKSCTPLNGYDLTVVVCESESIRKIPSMPKVLDKCHSFVECVSCKAVLHTTVFDGEWFITFDLHRINEICVDIANDSDYKKLPFNCKDSVENVLKMLDGFC
ncbi:2-oxoglutarate and iron-dependent oxygenase JMJD4-like isoform X2 [Mya arenaria]|uniref:2-oxoglutarate and iron-dependent oxygenase JMJD4-like isoform X2 n=1 Tax=Mya arenaria TaxID=6604 RepID=UPI0022E157AE|nr:2-oxoglutarate and iron-dependent oxygenase JMJD4-like isoform X2 [Mya arenaria]